MKQIDVFGNETETMEVVSKHNYTLKQKFRLHYGFLEGKYCKTCKYHSRFEYNYKYYHKCEKLGISNSSATDIRLKDVACKLYEEVK